MQPHLIRPSRAGLFTLALLGLPGGALAQFQPTPPTSGNLPSSQTQMVARPIAPPPSASFTQQQPAPPGYYPPYYPQWPVYSPTGAYLSGGSDVINSQANFMIAKQQSRVVKEQAEQAKLDTKRKAYEEWQWEQSQAPKLGDIQHQTQLDALKVARNNPSQNDIWSGYTLNILLKAIQRQESVEGLRGPTVPLDPNLVKNLNVTTGQTATTQGSIGMLKSNLDWPEVLTDERFSKETEQISQLNTEAMKQLMSGKADPGTIRALNNSIDALRSDLRANIAEIPSNQYTRGVAYVNQLKQAVGQMSSAGAANYVNGTWQAKGDSVGELVNYLTRQGLSFAPATAGHENDYTALYQGLIAYDSGLGRLARR
jgi:hypothetical protein